MGSTGRTRKSGAERRREIARATLKIIGERGLTSLTTAAIAEEIGVTSGALFRHFDSRDDILREAVRFALEQIEATFPDESLTPAERLMELAERRVVLLDAEPGIAWMLRSDQAYLALPEEAVDALRDMVERSRRFLLEAIREGAERGEFRADIEPEELVVPVIGTIHALIRTAGIHRLADRHQVDERNRILTALMRLLKSPQDASAPPGDPEGHVHDGRTDVRQSSRKRWKGSGNDDDDRT